jgi:hypothetical protein
LAGLWACVSAFTWGYPVGVPIRGECTRQDQLSHRVHQGADQGTSIREWEPQDIRGG